jgi:hypothetical protein
VRACEIGRPGARRRSSPNSLGRGGALGRIYSGRHPAIHFQALQAWQDTRGGPVGEDLRPPPRPQKRLGPGDFSTPAPSLAAGGEVLNDDDSPINFRESRSLLGPAQLGATQKFRRGNCARPASAVHIFNDKTPASLGESQASAAQVRLRRARSALPQHTSCTH